MHSQMISGFSSIGEGAAIAAAIGSAYSGVKGNNHGVHIIVLSVVHLAGGWKASVLVVTEPELENILQKRLLQKYEEEEYERTHPDQNKRHLKNDGKSDPHFDDYLHKNIHVHLSSDYQHLSEELELVLSPQIYEAHEIIVEPSYEHRHEIEPEVYFHFIEKGPLWDEIQSRFIDYEFHIAALSPAPEHAHSVSAEPRTPEGLDPRPDKPSKRRLINEALEYEN